VATAPTLAVCAEGFFRVEQVRTGSSRAQALRSRPARRRLIRQHECGFCLPAPSTKIAWNSSARIESHSMNLINLDIRMLRPDFGRRDRSITETRDGSGGLSRRSPSVAAARRTHGRPIFTHRRRSCFSRRRRDRASYANPYWDFMTKLLSNWPPRISRTCRSRHAGFYAAFMLPSILKIFEKPFLGADRIELFACRRRWVDV